MEKNLLSLHINKLVDLPTVAIRRQLPIRYIFIKPCTTMK